MDPRWLVWLMFLTVCHGYVPKKFPASEYYWPMEATNQTMMVDKKESSVQADLHGVKFIKVPRLISAASLRGNFQWIDVDAGVVKSCLAFQFSSCTEKRIALSFWLRIRNGRRVIATGSYTNSSIGPGVLIYYNAVTEILTANFTSSERHWSVSKTLRKYSWCHVTAMWTIGKGLMLVLDGHTKNPNVDSEGVAHKVEGHLYTKMITIGRSKNIADKDNYGDFDISHLVIYFRLLTKMEMLYLPKIALETGNENDLDCCVAKQNDPCYTNPCLNRKCLVIEAKYTNCVCPDLYHPKCPGFPSTIAPTTSSSCHHQFDSQKQTIFGCLNTITDKGVPECGSGTCYYGLCKSVNRVRFCLCPTDCSKHPTSLVCGSNGVTYTNLCTMKEAACKRGKHVVVENTGPCGSPLSNASHYWPLDGWDERGMCEDENGGSQTMLYNEIQQTKSIQLGNLLYLDGKDDWIDIKNLNDPCFVNLNCENQLFPKRNGISFSFWMKFYGGDYVFSSGGFTGTPTGPPGFCLKRDPVTKFYKLEVATTKNVWHLYIYKFPKNLFHFMFTWSKRYGLKLYINGEKTLSSNEPKLINHEEWKQTHVPNKIIFGRQDNQRTMPTFGQFKIGHVALWKRSLTETEIEEVYTANVEMTPEMELCCYKVTSDDSVLKACGRYFFPQKWNKVLQANCICPKIAFNKIADKCRSPPIGKVRALPGGGCYDMLDNCKVLVHGQKGFCDVDKGLAENDCAASCKFCVSNVLASIGRKQQFSRETLIFSLVGCIGGVLLLLCMTVYFWKIYRTRYHGAFVPPFKKVSLLDVSNNYTDDKWSNRYIDSSAYFIKDVPPKKRALPLIPAKINHYSQRYQPPEFD